MYEQNFTQMGKASTPFVVAKTLLSAMYAIPVTLIILAFVSLFAGTVGSMVVFYVLVFIGGSLSGIIYWFTRTLKYAVRVGHIAVVNHILTTGQVPASPVKHGVAFVKENFLQASAFFVLNRLIMRVLGSMLSLVQNIPFVGSLPFVGQILKKSMKYVDECVLGYIMINNRSHEPFRAGADGIVVYGVNYLPMLKIATRYLGKKSSLL